MQYFSLLVLLLALVSPALCGKAKKFRGGSGTRLQQITDLAASSPSNMITLDDPTYDYFAIQRPRGYQMVVYLTASAARFKCKVCKQLEKDFATVAAAYSESVKAKGEEPNIFFIKLDFNDNPKVFNDYEVNTVPMMFHVSKKQGEGEGPATYEIAIRDRFQIPNDVDAENVAKFVSNMSGYEIEIPQSMIWSYISMIVFFGAIVAAVPSIMRSLESFWLPLVQSKGLWGTISAGVYTCAISGFIFDIIRSPPMFYSNPQTGQIMFFYPQSGNQFVIEGFIIGFLNIGCALSLLFMTMWAPKMKSPSKQFWGMLGGMACFAFCFWQIKGFYIMKNRWYGQNM